jgi:hypothetical protein
MEYDAPLDQHIKAHVISDTLKLIAPCPINRAQLHPYVQQKATSGQWWSRRDAPRTAAATRAATNQALQAIFDGRTPQVTLELPDTELGGFRRLAPSTLSRKVHALSTSGS